MQSGLPGGFDGLAKVNDLCPQDKAELIALLIEDWVAQTYMELNVVLLEVVQHTIPFVENVQPVKGIILMTWTQIAEN